MNVEQDEREPWSQSHGESHGVILMPNRHGEYEEQGIIDQHDPFWIGYYDAMDPHTVVRPYSPRTLWPTYTEARLRWYAGASHYWRIQRVRRYWEERRRAEAIARMKKVLADLSGT